MTTRKSPAAVCNVVRIILETGLRLYKELLAMKKEQLGPGIVDASGARGFPRSDATPPRSLYLFPSDQNPSGHNSENCHASLELKIVPKHTVCTRTVHHF